MKTSIYKQLTWVAMAAPLVYLGVVWNNLPDIVPTHFGISGKPDGFGPKWSLLFLNLVSIGVYFLLKYVPQLDPRLREVGLGSHYEKLQLLILTFLSAVQATIIYAAQTGIAGSTFTNLMAVGVSLLLAGMGNYLINVKPNYFVGFKTPWTLESDIVWRKTHQVGGRLFFWGGILSAVLVLFLPPTWKIATIVAISFSIGIYTLWYSYRVFQLEKNNIQARKDV